MDIRRQLRIYQACPEIRSNMRRMYLAKMMAWMTVIISSPLLLVSLLCVGLVHVFDFIGQYTVWPAHRAVEWLHEYQRSQIRQAHSIVDVETIQQRIGDNNADL